MELNRSANFFYSSTILRSTAPPQPLL